MPITQEQIQEARLAADAYLDSLITKYGTSRRPTAEETREADRLEQVYRDLTTQMIEEGGEVVTPKKQANPMDALKQIVPQLDDEQLKELKELIAATETEREEYKKNIFVHLPGKTVHFQATDEHPEEEPIKRLNILVEPNFGYSFTVPGDTKVEKIITKKWLKETEKEFGKLVAQTNYDTYQFDTELFRVVDLANHWRKLFTDKKVECGDLVLIDDGN